MLGVCRRRRLAQLARQALGKSHPLALNICARILPALQSGRIINKSNTDLFQNGFCIRLDNLQRFFVQNFIVRNIALDILRSLNRTAVRSARRAAPPPPRARRRSPTSAMIHAPRKVIVPAIHQRPPRYGQIAASAKRKRHAPLILRKTCSRSRATRSKPPTTLPYAPRA